MFSLVLKKWFYECWDHLLILLLGNLLFIVLLSAGVTAFAALSSLRILPSLVVALLCMTLLGICSLVISKYFTSAAWIYSVSIKDILPMLKKHWLAGMLGGLSMGIFGILLWIALPFYGTMSSLFSSLAVGILFWGTFIWLISIQYYAPLRIQLENNFAKVLKKCFLISLDNLLFSIALFLCSLILLGISIFTAFLFPGPTGILHLWQVALKLRLYKYDTKDKPPDWTALLEEEKEQLGNRTLKGFIFPWKD